MRKVRIEAFFGYDGLHAIASCAENVEILLISDYQEEIPTKGLQALAEVVKNRKCTVNIFEISSGGQVTLKSN